MWTGTLLILTGIMAGIYHFVYRSLCFLHHFPGTNISTWGGFQATPDVPLTLLDNHGINKVSNGGNDHIHCLYILLFSCIQLEVKLTFMA